jgi:hypothetical protein
MGLERPSRGFGTFFFCTSETSREEAGAERVVPDLFSMKTPGFYNEGHYDSHVSLMVLRCSWQGNVLV